MITILAIDPGPTASGWCLYKNRKVIAAGKMENNQLRAYLKTRPGQELAIEKIASYGMPVGEDVFTTCIWVGRFIEAWVFPCRVKLVPRKDIKLHLCGTVQAKDANIRQALIDKFPPTGCGKIRQIGTKLKPGPLYGIKYDAWSALALAVTVSEQNL